MRYLLDTNVVSELRKGPAADRSVVAWIGSVDSSADLGMSVLVLGEVRQGVERLQRRGDREQANLLAVWLERLRAEFDDRLLEVSREIAERWGALRAHRPVPPVDGLMAATALEHDLTFVTRDTSAVVATGVRLLNPWDSLAP